MKDYDPKGHRPLDFVIDPELDQEKWIKEDNKRKNKAWLFAVIICLVYLAVFI